MNAVAILLLAVGAFTGLVLLAMLVGRRLSDGTRCMRCGEDALEPVPDARDTVHFASVRCAACGEQFITPR